MSCITVNPGCPSVIPDNAMCLTIHNIAKQDVTVTQKIAPPTIPACFKVTADSKVSVLVGRGNVFTVIGTNGKVYDPSLSPQQPSYTYLVEDYTPAPAMLCGNKPFPDQPFFGVAAAFLVLGIVGHKFVDKTPQATPEYTNCLGLQGPGICSKLFPQKKRPKTFLFVGVVLAMLTMLAYLLFKGPLGKILAGEPKYPINCQDCLKRGDEWQFTEPSENDGVTGWKLWLRKMRCRFGQSAGPCMCFAPQQRKLCALTAAEPNAPKNLKWQPNISNMDLIKYNPNKSNFGTEADVCACCTSEKGDQCFDLATATPLGNPCKSV
jgi:hypothetical protein